MSRKLPRKLIDYPMSELIALWRDARAKLREDSPTVRAIETTIAKKEERARRMEAAHA
jgi:hypothetical protein